ncbi:hypothetical protein BDV09DRAFT_13863 [Aspergillus tetrazonus]
MASLSHMRIRIRGCIGGRSSPPLCSLLSLRVGCESFGARHRITRQWHKKLRDPRGDLKIGEDTILVKLLLPRVHQALTHDTPAQSAARHKTRSFMVNGEHPNSAFPTTNRPCAGRCNLIRGGLTEGAPGNAFPVSMTVTFV